METDASMNVPQDDPRAFLAYDPQVHSTLRFRVEDGELSVEGDDA